MDFLRNAVLNPHAPSQAPFSYKDSPRSGPAWAEKFRVMRISGFCTHVECHPKTPKHHFLRRKSNFSPQNLGIEWNSLTPWGSATSMRICSHNNIPPTPKESGSRSIWRFQSEMVVRAPCARRDRNGVPLILGPRGSSVASIAPNWTGKELWHPQNRPE